MRKVLSVFMVLMLTGLVVGCAPKVANDYSAESVTRFAGKTQNAKLYSSGGNWRVETESFGKKGIMIVRLDKKVSWMLMPEQKMYIEQKLKPDMLMGKTAKMPGEIERKKLGQEKVNGILCDKYQVIFKVNEKSEPTSVFQWVSKDQIPMKSSSVDGSWSSELKNIKRGKQPAKLFDLPAGYKKLSLPGNIFK
ncbi:MAG: DUF4412 domain-containing protein [Candidatus Margulisbacteria bacterium]|nr:DUF4412 domain-containing protein [Candidatus Margulisiibacteriota bacterium]